ncbi:AraC family transcriptional regulator [Marinomonas sp.]|nr:AraC family transcriptional regulator [Marinomonas sp.]MDB4837905.1 AraC family transcriptional regulator [Marinomonas sp.]
MTPSTHPLFWRDADLPFVELRQVLDGRGVSYSPHTHEEWSIGAILEGQSEFLCADRLHKVERGALVMMNPDEVHACNPDQGSPWGYYMMHINKKWLTQHLFEQGIRADLQWQDTRVDTVLSKAFYDDFVLLCERLMSTEYRSKEKAFFLKGYFFQLFTYLDITEKVATLLPANKLYNVADYLNTHCLQDTPIEDISAEFGFSTAHFVRAFKRHFNMTPHAYRLNKRIQLGQQALKQGHDIADIAQAVGFSDQAHFQRVFKKRVAATPHQYRRSISSL